MPDARTGSEHARQKDSLIRVLRLKVKDLEALLARRETELKATPNPGARGRAELEHLREQIRHTTEKVRALEEERAQDAQEPLLVALPSSEGRPSTAAPAVSSRPAPPGSYERLRDDLMGLYRRWETFHRMQPEELRPISMELGLELEQIVTGLGRARPSLPATGPAAEPAPPTLRAVPAEPAPAPPGDPLASFPAPGPGEADRPRLTPIERCLEEARAAEVAGDLLKARAHYSQALRIDKAHVGATLGLARAHESEGDYAGASGLLDRLLRSPSPAPEARALAERVAWKRRALEQFEASLKTLR